MSVLHFTKNTAGRDFAVGDIHGCFSRLLSDLDSLGFDRSVDRLFSVGDLVDRGPESHRFEEFLSYPWFHAVQGNHEDMAIRWPNGHMDPQNYAANGGSWNLLSSPEQNRARADILNALPVAIEVDTEDGLIGIVHADVPGGDWQQFKRDLDTPPDAPRWLVKTVREGCMWDRTRIESEDRSGVTGIHAVVVGHTPLTEPVILGNVYHIDTMGWRPQGRFTFLDLATLKALHIAPELEF